jgi:hypothetical protein
MSENASSPPKDGNPRRGSLKRRWAWIVLALAVIALAMYWPHRGELASARISKGDGVKNAGKGPPAIPVVALRARTGNIGVYFYGLGAVTPISTLPSAAIQRTSNTAFVYLVTPDSKVTVRNVTIGVSEGDDSEIASGPKAGDVVVLMGVDKLQEGSAVNPQIQGERSGPGDPRGGSRK